MFKYMSPWGTFLIQAKAAPMCQVSTGLDEQSSEKLILKAELELGEMAWFVPPPFYFSWFWKVCLYNVTLDVESHLIELKDLLLSIL